MILSILEKYPSLCKQLSIFLLIGFFISSYAVAQLTLEGKVLDRQTLAPLPFATIIYDQQLRKGAIADIDGNFSMNLRTLPDSLFITYLGYAPLTIHVDSISPNIPLKIFLSPTNFALSEVLIEAERNPAESLIRKVIANKDRNNPKRVTSFKCETYNKVTYDQYKPLLSTATSEERDSLQNVRRIPDSIAFFMMESVTELKYVFPDKMEETIKAINVAGFKKPSFGPIASEVQPFSFYNETILIMDRYFINPISNGSPKRYDFRLIDTIYQEIDTVYVITFQPKKGKNFDGLTGTLYINTFHYAIQNVIAHPSDQGPIKAQIEQKYICLDRKQWFPHQLNIEVAMPHFPSENMGMQISGKSYIRNVELEVELNPQKFSFKQIHIDKNAHDQAPDFWVKHRIDTLSLKEKNTYTLLNKVGTKFNFDEKLRMVEKISAAKFPLGPFDLDLNKLYVYNEFETHRLGLGFYTNERVLPWASLGGYIAYGIRDKGWKYGGSLEVDILPSQEWKFMLSYSDDVLQPGQSTFPIQSGFTNPASFISSRMDRVKQKRAETSWRMFRFLQTSLSLSQYQRQPLYAYSFEPLGADSIVRATDIQLYFRYAFGEKIIENFGQNLILDSKYPVLEFSYIRGVNDFLSGELSYDKLEFRLSYDWVSRQLGESSLRIQAGMTNGDIPANWLFHGAGSKSKSVWLLVPHTFQTMRPYEFLSDKYAFAFWSQDIGSRLLKGEKFKPRLIFIQGVGWGTLENPEAHDRIEFQSMKKGYFESGLMVRDLIKINLKIAYIGFGGGIYYRYGPYHLPKQVDNMAFKLAFGVSYF